MPEPAKQPDTDEQLLVRLRTGDREAFGPLVQRYERELYGYLRRYLGNEDLADDVFQTTFLAIFRKIKQYEPGRAARPWIYAIATNQAIDALRKQNRRADHRADLIASPDEEGEPRPLLDLIPSAEFQPADQADLAEQRHLVRTAVARLPDLLREVILLAYFQGMKYRDIAETLEIPLGTVKSRLHAALVKFTEEWQSLNAKCEVQKVESQAREEEFEAGDAKSQVRDAKGEVRNAKGQVSDTKCEGRNAKGEARNAKGQVSDTKGKGRNAKGEVRNAK